MQLLSSKEYLRVFCLIPQYNNAIAFSAILALSNVKQNHIAYAPYYVDAG